MTFETVTISRPDLARVRDIAKAQSARWGNGRRVTIEPGIRYNLETEAESINARIIDKTRDWEDSDLMAHGTWQDVKDPLPLDDNGTGETDLYVYARDGLACNIQIEYDRAGLVAVHADAEKNVWHRDGAEPFDAVALEMERRAAAESEPQPAPRGADIVADFEGDTGETIVSLEIDRVGEWSDYCEAIGWGRPSDPPESVFWTVYGRTSEGFAAALGDYPGRAAALLAAESLTQPIKHCPPMLPAFRMTWETVTNESAEIGDAAQRGFVAPDTGAPLLLGPLTQMHSETRLCARLRDFLPHIEPGGAAYLEGVEPDNSDHSAARSVRFIWAVWGRNGVISETRTIHFPETLTPASRARLVTLLKS